MLRQFALKDIKGIRACKEKIYYRVGIDFVLPQYVVLTAIDALMKDSAYLTGLSQGYKIFFIILKGLSGGIFD